MRLSNIAPFALAFALAGGAAYVAAMGSVKLLERNSIADVAFELELAGHDWASVQADGLQVILSGEAPTEATRFNALSVSGTVVDAARLIDNMNVTEAQEIVAPRFSIEILRNDAGVSLIGLIPQDTDRDLVLSRIERVVGDAPVTDLLETSDFPEPDGWAEAVDYALDSLRDLPRSKISVEAGSLDITAITDSQSEKARLEGQLTRNAPPEVLTAIHISAPRPVISPFTLRFLSNGSTARFDACSADTETSQRAILAAAVQAGMNDKGECRLGLGVPTTQWGEAGVVAIRAVGELGSGSVTIADTEVTLIATEGTDADLFNRVSARLERDLPDLFSLTAVLPTPVDDSEEGPAEFIATRSPEGDVQVRGHMGDTLSTNAVENYAKARFGADTVYVVPEDHSALPQRWSLRVLAGLAALAELNNGAVTVTEDRVSVRGNSGNPNISAAVAQVLADELGEGQDFSINVSYSEALDPNANIPTVAECIEQVVSIGTAQKITFEPGSSTLDSASQQTVRQIADVLRTCPEFEMEVAGHTDSQGREEMNLSLSQTRAEAVLTALRDERIAWPGLRAQGYGETTPIADNGTEEGREANRRIEFTLIETDTDATDADPAAADSTEEETESE
ncbi:OmpA family protein [Shimia ponticola]|uniref:OmpA family protein n=1 Tax=Shimia ponticola TaxID=2582893 RepID=UPI0011BEB170|nr:OmpA family protein [Shimia ponticola]